MNIIYFPIIILVYEIVCRHLLKACKYLVLLEIRNKAPTPLTLIFSASTIHFE